MNKLAKAAIVCAVIFLVFSIASAFLFIAAAPEISQQANMLTEGVNRWYSWAKETFPNFKGEYYDEDGHFTFYWDVFE